VGVDAEAADAGVAALEPADAASEAVEVAEAVEDVAIAENSEIPKLKIAVMISIC
jgi:hypothetical protein